MKHDAAAVGKFLRSRRSQLVRADLGMPPNGRATVGLRREEVAYLSGVSITWYTWLEQGREVTPSRQVLDSLALTLRLSHTERVYLLGLAGYGTPHPDKEPNPGTVPAHMQRLLDALTDFPAMAVATDWTVLAWNAAYVAVYPNIATVAVADRNFLWLLFTDPDLRTLIPDWEVTGAYNVASFRAEAGNRLDEPPFADLVRRLLQTSAEFRSTWESFDIDTMSSRVRHFRHAVVGDLHMEQHVLAPTDHPNLRLVTFIPTADSDTVDKLRALIALNLASR